MGEWMEWNGLDGEERPVPCWLELDIGTLATGTLDILVLVEDSCIRSVKFVYFQDFVDLKYSVLYIQLAISY